MNRVELTSGKGRVFQGTLQFSLLQTYQGTQVEWKPFLALYAATGPEMYAKSVELIRLV